MRINKMVVWYVVGVFLVSTACVVGYYILVHADDRRIAVDRNIVVLSPDLVGKVVRLEGQEPLFCGESNSRKMRLVNKMGYSVQIGIKSNCTCTSASVYPQSIGEGEQATIEVGYDSRKSPCTSGTNKDVMIVVNISKSNTLDESQGASIGLVYSLLLEEAFYMTRSVEFGRVDRRQHSLPTKMVAFENMSIYPIDIEFQKGSVRQVAHI